MHALGRIAKCFWVSPGMVLTHKHLKVRSLPSETTMKAWAAGVIQMCNMDRVQLYRSKVFTFFLKLNPPHPLNLGASNLMKFHYLKFWVQMKTK